ncbi:uncharacterized protein itprid1 [Pholidichthys leucotaenia]
MEYFEQLVTQNIKATLSPYHNPSLFAYSWLEIDPLMNVKEVPLPTWFCVELGEKQLGSQQREEGKQGTVVAEREKADNSAEEEELGRKVGVEPGQSSTSETKVGGRAIKKNGVGNGVEDCSALRKNPSSEDDLALGVEASLYGKQRVKTVQEYLGLNGSSPDLSRWNSLGSSSATSGPSGPLSVMDILNLWSDDPEELLLDLGFGCDEPDLSGRIPARFINYQSQARGINLQVFLEAQQNRIDLENPDVSNRFRQLEVLQQVTTAFSCLMGPSSSPPKKDLLPEAQERRKRVGMLFRRASKQSVSTIQHQKPQDQTLSAVNSVPDSLQTTISLRDTKVSLKRQKPGPLENGCLSPLIEEQGVLPDIPSQPHLAIFTAQVEAVRPPPLKEGHPLAANNFLQRKKSLSQARESFEMEEVHSFDESSVTGSYTGGAENLVRNVVRTNSVQSDSSGFLEEPYVPSIPQLPKPRPDIIKALLGLSGASTDSQDSEKLGSSPFPHPAPTHFLISSLTSANVDTDFPSPHVPLDSLVDFGTAPSPVLLHLSKSDLQLDTEARVYWAEPVQVSSITTMSEDVDSLEASDGSPTVGAVDVSPLTDKEVPTSPSAILENSGSATSNKSSFSTLAPSSLKSTTLNSEPSSRSVSVQMPSLLSSHIVQRRDVPYTAESKHTILSNIFPLDTSTPFRAVQSWTDLQMQRNALTKKLSYGACHSAVSKVTMSMSAPEIANRCTDLQILSLSPSFYQLSRDWKSQDSVPEMADSCDIESASVDTGLCPDEQEEAEREYKNDNNDKIWEGKQTGSVTCCCSCGHHCACSIQKRDGQYINESFPYSLGELEEMMFCLQHFRSVLSNMEEQLSEDQAAVYTALSEEDREKVREVEELRCAVKHEAGELEMQLNELVHHYDESLKMKMHRLLDEQSLLCSQLRVFLPGNLPFSANCASSRTVATQCCLLPWFHQADTGKGHGNAPSKADKLDLEGFLQKLKESLHHSVNTDSSETEVLHENVS